MKSGIDGPRSVGWADTPLVRLLAVVGEKVQE